MNNIFEMNVRNYFSKLTCAYKISNSNIMIIPDKMYYEHIMK